jgi:hypothetical protein
MGQAQVLDASEWLGEGLRIGEALRHFSHSRRCEKGRVVATS